MVGVIVDRSSRPNAARLLLLLTYCYRSRGAARIGVLVLSDDLSCNGAN